MEKKNELTVEEKVKAMIREVFDVKDEKLSLETTVKDLGVDSLDILDLVNEIEGAFNIEVEDKDLYRMNTVGDMVKYINDAKNENKNNDKDNQIENKNSKYQYESNENFNKNDNKNKNNNN